MLDDDSDAPGAGPEARPGRDLPVDAHVHTDLSPDADVPLDVYAELAIEQGIAEFAVTDHVDFDPRDPAYDYASFEERERVARDAAERWAPKGVRIWFGAELTFNTAWEEDLRDHLRRHRYDFTIGSVHDWPDSPYVPSRVGTWAAGRTLAEAVAPYVEQVTAAAATGLFDTIGHLDVVRRYLHARFPAPEVYGAVELFEPALRALVDSGTALEVNSSGFRHPAREAYPGPPIVARYRELGGRAVTAGSDSHRANHFSWALEAGYRLVSECGFDALAFRRGSERASIQVPQRFRARDGTGRLA